MWRDAHVLLRVIRCASQLDGQRSYKHSCHKWERALGRRRAGGEGSIGTCLQALMKVLISVLQNLRWEQPLHQTPPVTHSSLTTSFSCPGFSGLLSQAKLTQGGGGRWDWAVEGKLSGALCSNGKASRAHGCLMFIGISTHLIYIIINLSLCKND